MVPGRRKKDTHLPRRVYPKHNALHFVSKSGKWHRLGPLDMPLPDILRAVAALLETTNTGIMAGVFDRYRLEVLPKKALRTIRNQTLELARLEKVFGHMRPEDVQPSDCWQYYTARGGNSAAHHEVRLLSNVFTWARRWGVVATNPAQRLGLPTPQSRDRYVDDLEFAEYRTTVPEMVALMMDATRITALREGDLLALERRNLTDEGIRIQPGKTAHSTRKVLIIEWSPELHQIIDTVLAISPRVRQYLFCRRDGKRMSSSGFQSIWQRLMKKWEESGRDRFTFHDLRAKGLSDEETLEGAAARAGHADARVTQKVYRRKPQRVKPLAILDMKR